MRFDDIYAPRDLGICELSHLDHPLRVSHDPLHFRGGVRHDESAAVVDGGTPAQPGEGRLTFVVARRLEKWPHDESRSEGARMLDEGASLAEVLRRYPDAVPSVHRGKPVEPARRAIYAHYALLQELQGEPDIDTADGATVEKVIRDQGIEWACVRTGSALTRYRNAWPDLRWYRSQAPDSWATEYEGLRRPGPPD